MAKSTGFRVRDAVPGDAAALAELHVATFKEAHGRLGAPTIELRKRQWRAAFDHPTDWLLSAEGEFHGGYGWRDLQRLVGAGFD